MNNARIGNAPPKIPPNPWHIDFFFGCCVLMFAIKHYPEQIKGKELDDYLANGWYRMGQTIFTTHFLCFGEAFYSAIWVRLDLEKHEFSKSLRKIIKRNNERFQFHFGKAVIDISRENLYQRYRVTFPGFRLFSPELTRALEPGPP